MAMLVQPNLTFIPNVNFMFHDLPNVWVRTTSSTRPFTTKDRVALESSTEEEIQQLNCATTYLP